MFYVAGKSFESPVDAQNYADRVNNGKIDYMDNYLDPQDRENVIRKDPKKAIIFE